MLNTYEQKWQRLKEIIDSKGIDGEELVSALKDYYSVFDDALLVWLAGLYNSKIGGFHYSNSSRDNEYIDDDRGKYPLLPDIESTYQALSLLLASKTISSFDELPEKMREGMKKFVCSLQDKKTGFIYHPQWLGLMQDGNSESADASKMWMARRGRDMAWAIGMTERLKFSLPYKTAYERLETVSNSSESDKSEDLPDYLMSKEAFIDYLNTLDWDKNAYYSGNMISAQTKLIESAGLGRVAVDFLNEKQNKDTGLWGSVGGYAAINAYLKITCLYNSLYEEIPNCEKAVISVLECATTEEPAQTVCYQYNVWYSIKNIINNLREFGGQNKDEKVERIRLLVMKNAKDAIKATKEKVEKFKKTDSSFSYLTYACCAGSQGMPVALKNMNEGDVNASVICTSGTAGNIFEVLGLEEYMIPLFSEDARDIFISALKI